MSGLRVLITNKSFMVRGGTELYVRDLAESLLQRGHFPIVYSIEAGEVAREIRALSVPFVEDLNKLATPPDIIHGQDHMQTMIALLHFRDMPAVFFCHGWLAWEAIAPQFPRIRRYVAVDQVCRDRMVCENGIPENRIRILLNFVDLRRFKPRSPLPQHPKRALIFNNYATEKNSIGAIREACTRAGIALDVIGLGAGNHVVEPESILGNYDIVFAKGRSALEALAVGAAVVPCDKGRVGPMVSTAEFDRLRLLNFGWSALCDPVDPEVIEREIGRYNAEDAGHVSRRVRATAGRDLVVDQIVSLYHETIAENTSVSKSERHEESGTTAKYLASMMPAFRDVFATHDRAYLAELARDRAQAESEQTRARLAEADQAMNSMAAQSTEENERLVMQIALLESASKELRSSVEAKDTELKRITNSLAWRLVNHYGPIKYRFALPFYQGVRKLFRDDYSTNGKRKPT